MADTDTLPEVTISSTGLPPSDPTGLDSTGGLQADLKKAIDIQGNYAPTKQEIDTDKADIKALRQKEDQIADRQISNLERGFDQAPPQQDTNVLGGLFPLLAIAAFGGSLTRASANAMLGSSIGMVKGYTEGKEELYQQQRKAYEDAYQKFRDNQENIDKVYQVMRKAYGDRIDADQKALEMAYNVTGNQIKNLQTLIQDHANTEHWAEQVKEHYDRMEETRTHDRAMEHIAERKEDDAHAKAVAALKKSGASLSPEAIDQAASRLVNGEKPNDVLYGLGRGTQGAANITAVMNRFAELAEGAGMSAMDIATQKQELAAEARTRLELGRREGLVAPRVKEAENFAQLALNSSAKVSRADWRSWNEVIQWGAKKTNAPGLGEFQVANNSLVNAYAAAVGGGVIHVEDQKRGNEMLSTADSPQTYAAKVQQLLKETKEALAAPGQVMQDLRNQDKQRTAGIANGSVQPTAQQPAGASQPVKAVDKAGKPIPDGTKMTSKSGKPMIVQNGYWVYVQ